MTALNQWDEPVAAEASAAGDWGTRSRAIAAQTGRHSVRLARTTARSAVSAISLGWLTFYAILAGIAIQGLLVHRVWAQLMGETGIGGLRGFAYDLSSTLVAPFHSFEPTTPVKDTGILEFSSLVAIEAYLIVTLVVLTLLFSARIAVAAEKSLARRSRRRRNPGARPIVLDAPDI